MLTSTQQTLAELRRQLVAPARADLPRIAEQVSGIAAGLSHWMDRFCGRRDQASSGCLPCWLAGFVGRWGCGLGWELGRFLALHSRLPTTCHILCPVGHKCVLTTTTTTRST